MLLPFLIRILAKTIPMMQPIKNPPKKLVSELALDWYSGRFKDGPSSIDKFS